MITKNDFSIVAPANVEKLILACNDRYFLRDREENRDPEFVEAASRLVCEQHAESGIRFAGNDENGSFVMIVRVERRKYVLTYSHETYVGGATDNFLSAATRIHGCDRF